MVVCRHKKCSLYIHIPNHLDNQCCCSYKIYKHLRTIRMGSSATKVSETCYSPQEEAQQDVENAKKTFTASHFTANRFLCK